MLFVEAIDYRVSPDGGRIELYYGEITAMHEDGEVHL